MKFKTAKSYNCKIYIAGDIGQIKQVCRKYCYKIGLCVTVSPTTYIYTGGEEEGAIIGFIQYPRFPKSHHKIKIIARNLGNEIMKRCCQQSFIVETLNKTYWFSRRPEDVK